MAACNSSTTTRVKVALSASISQFKCFSRTDKVLNSALFLKDSMATVWGTEGHEGNGLFDS